MVRLLFFSLVVAVLAPSVTVPVVALSSESATIPAVLAQAKEVAAGGSHTCALTLSGEVWCWGWNETGQLGDGTTTNHYSPVRVSGLSGGVTGLAAGEMHSCAVTGSGGVKCWGYNNYGQLGDGTTENRLAPVDVVGLASGAVSVTAGSGHTCALTGSGGLKCWGRNASGQLGDGTTVDRPTPAEVSTLTSGVSLVDAGLQHTCALTEAGAARCWGHNYYGQTGNGTPSNYVATPVDVVGLTGGTMSLTAGGSHTCALVSGGGVKCWGDNQYGQLGDGTTAESAVPVNAVGLGSGVVYVAAGDNHTCSIGDGGDAKCWGRNNYGQVGDGSLLTRTSPRAVTRLAAGADSISAGSAHTCAITDSGAMRCWGSGGYGRLGDGDDYEPQPVIRFGKGTADSAAGRMHTCAISAGGEASCWGSNDYGQLGDGTKTSRYTPSTVSGLAGGTAKIATYAYHSCAVTNSGGAKCWGYNSSGQLGDGTTTERTGPVDVVGLTTGVVSLATGYVHTCALTNAGGVKCWGSNGMGQLGDGTTTTRLTPVDVMGLTSGVASITAGELHTCAVTTAGGVKCWGDNYYGQLGDGTTTGRKTPTDVTGLSSGGTAVSAGMKHTCGVTSGAGIKCWGDNQYGQLGDGTTTKRTSPVDVPGLTSGSSNVDAGESHTCAVTTGGGAKCWGQNYSGQLGDGTTSNRHTPTNVTGLESGVSTVAAGNSHTCAITSIQATKCWGSNTYGQLGHNPGWQPLVVTGFEGQALACAPAGDDVMLSWPHWDSSAVRYEVYRSEADPFFRPDDGDAFKLSEVLPPALNANATHLDEAVLGPAAAEYFYRVYAVDGTGDSYLVSNPAGAFIYALVRGTP